jgi:hypothetical protein
LGVAGLVENGGLMTVLTFGIVILSNILQGLSIGVIIRSQRLVVDDIRSNEVESSFRFSELYDPEGYKFNVTLFEKLLFSLPEFFIFETVFGRWLSAKLVYLLGVLNKYLIDRMASTTKGITIFFIRGIVNSASNLLNIINRYLLRKEIVDELKD